MPKITTREATDGFAAFMAGEAAKIRSPRDRFIVYAALGAAKNNPEGVIAPFRKPLEAVGIIDADGMVDTDAVKAALVSAFANVPTVEMYGFTFTENDAAELLRHMARK